MPRCRISEDDRLVEVSTIFNRMNIYNDYIILSITVISRLLGGALREPGLRVKHLNYRYPHKTVILINMTYCWT